MNKSIALKGGWDNKGNTILNSMKNVVFVLSELML